MSPRGDRRPGDADERPVADVLGLSGADGDDARGGSSGTGGGPPTGGVDVESLRAALSASAGRPAADRTAPQAAAGRRAERRDTEAQLRRRARRRRRSVLVALVVLALIVAAVGYLVVRWQTPPTQEVKDYAGTGDTQVVVRIDAGDGLADIAGALAAAQVVASAQAFVDTAGGDADVSAVQPGYYRLRAHSSARSAADQLVDPQSRVGQVRLVPGLRLADVRTSGGRTVPGYLTLIARAACVPLNGRTECTSPEELSRVAASVAPADIGVVDWAVSPVSDLPEGVDRLDGLLVPGDYDVPPGADAKTLLTAVFSAAAARWNSSEIIAGAANQGLTPYQAVIVASVVERESNTADMPQVARVIYNRMATKMKWQMDSTVNYALDRAQLAVSLDDLEVDSPYNTYRVAGMPPGPISSPGQNALEATFDPIPGRWLYFVKVDKEGNSCFSVTAEQHEACIRKARQAGVLGGG